MKDSKRFVSLLLSLVMVLSIVAVRPSSAYAAPQETGLKAVIKGTDQTYMTLEPFKAHTLEVEASVDEGFEISYTWSADSGMEITVDESDPSKAYVPMQFPQDYDDFPGSYSCTVSDNAGNSVRLFFQPPLPSAFDRIIAVNEGDDLVLNAAPEGFEGDVTYQWIKLGDYSDYKPLINMYGIGGFTNHAYESLVFMNFDGAGSSGYSETIIPDETNAELVLSDINMRSEYLCKVSSEYGTYSVWFAVYVENGMYDSRGINTTTTTKQTVEVGSEIEIDVATKVKEGPLSYQWFYPAKVPVEGSDYTNNKWLEATEYADQKTISFTLTEDMLEDYGFVRYLCVVRDQYGNSEHRLYFYYLDDGFRAKAKDDKTIFYVKKGSTVRLEVEAETTEEGVLSYRWNGYSDTTAAIELTAEKDISTACIVRDGLTHDYSYHSISFLVYVMSVPEYEWTEDNSKVTASASASDGHIETETVDVTKAAGTNNTTVCTATFENPLFAAQIKTIEGSRKIALVAASDEGSTPVEIEIDEETPTDILTPQKAAAVEDEVLEDLTAEDLTVLWQKELKVPAGAKFPIEITFVVPEVQEDELVLIYHFDTIKQEWELVGKAYGNTVRAVFSSLSPVAVVTNAKDIVGDFILGDVTGDGEVSADDLTMLSRHVAHIELISDQTLLKAADVNSDKEVDANDLTMLSRFVAQIISEFPQPENEMPDVFPENVTVYISQQKGSSSDTVDRIMVDYWKEKYPDVTFNVINTEGNGQTEAAAVANAQDKGDGSVLLMAGVGSIMRFYAGEWNYNLANRSFFKPVCAGIGQMQPSGGVILINAQETRFSDIPTLIAYIKAHPGEVRISYTSGTANEVRLKTLLNYYGVRSSDVVKTTSSTADIRSWIQGGMTDVAIMTETLASQDISGGKVKGILNTVPDRSLYTEEMTPLIEVPVLSELPGMRAEDIDGLVCEWPMVIYAPASISDDLCGSISKLCASILEDDDYMVRIKELGPTNTYQVYTVKELSDLHEKSDRQISLIYSF